MTINLHVSLCPDGDFSLRDNEKYHMEWDGDDYYQEYLFYEGLPRQTWEHSTDHTFDPLWRAVSLLEKMLCDIHVSYTHHYLIGLCCPRSIFHKCNGAVLILSFN